MVSYPESCRPSLHESFPKICRHFPCALLLIVLRPPYLVELSSLRCSPELGNQPTTPMLAAQRCTSQRLASLQSRRTGTALVDLTETTPPSVVPRASHPPEGQRCASVCDAAVGCAASSSGKSKRARLLRCRALPLLLQFVHNVIDGMAHGTEWLVWFRFSRYRSWVTAGCRCGVAATLFRSSLMHAAVSWFLVLGLLATHSCQAA